MSDDTPRDAFVSKLGYAFRDEALLDRALTHASFAHDRVLAAARGGGDPTNATDAGGASGGGLEAADHNERLEFLGDAVLAMVVAEALHERQPSWREGDLTRALHAIVEGRSLVKWARALGLGPALRLGATEESSGGGDKPSILEDAMEAVIGAIYLDGGLDPVRALVRRSFAEALSAEAPPVARDPKTALQEDLMAEVGAFPTYRVVTDTGVEGDDERFTVEVVSEERALARGIGRTKRAAERAAARSALAERRAADGAKRDG